MSKIDSPRDIRIPRKKNTEHKSPNKPSCSPKNIQVPTSSPPHGSTQSLHDENGGGIEPPTDPLLDAIWRSPDKVHQLATRNRKTGQFHHKIVDDIGGIPDILEDLELGTEIYFACAEYLKPSNRTAANVSGAYAFWLDIDCGEDKASAGKGYATQSDAKKALRKFCTESGIPQPTFIVDSGGGLHVYWVLSHFLPRARWIDYASKIKKLGKTFALRADDSRTADIASVLRIPGTLNHKYNPPRPVRIVEAENNPIDQQRMLDAIDRGFEKHCGSPESKTTKTTDANNTTQQGSDGRYGPPDIDRLRSALTTLDPDCDEETWKLKRIAPLARGAKKNPELAGQLRQLAKSWSSGELRGESSKAWTTPGNTNDLTGEEAFDPVWDRFTKDTYTGKGTTLGTIYHDATDAGWVDDTGFQIIDDNRDAEDITASGDDLEPLAWIQQRYAMINMTGRLCVLDRQTLGKQSNRSTASPLALSNRSDGALLITRAVKAKYPEKDASKIANKFFSDPDTTCYNGVEFNPAGTSDNYLNLWVGPTIDPKAGEWPLIKAFLIDVICGGDDKSYHYLIQYIAHALQHPEEKPGVILIMLGGQGTGKGTLGRIMRLIWSATFLLVHNIDTVTGNFNASLERAFIVFLDEALFVGNRRSTDALKSLVTEPVFHINEKHQPARQINSYHRFIAATNADHMKHTEKDDRRDFVLRVAEDRKGDHAYWQELNHEIDNGGVEAMVHDLLVMDLSVFNVRDKPETRELLEQKLQSLEPIERWWHDCLQRGGITEDDNWQDFISTADAIDGVMEIAGGKIFKKPTSVDMVRTLTKLCPSAKRKQQTSNYRKRRGFELPPLEQARKEFAEYIGGKLTW